MTSPDLIFQNKSAGFGTLHCCSIVATSTGLSRHRRAGPSASLDKSLVVFDCAADHTQGVEFCQIRSYECHRQVQFRRSDLSMQLLTRHSRPFQERD